MDSDRPQYNSVFQIHQGSFPEGHTAFLTSLYILDIDLKAESRQNSSMEREVWHVVLSVDEEFW